MLDVYAKNYINYRIGSKKETLQESVANEIFKQLGGNKFVTMTGAKNLISGNDYLSFRIPKAKDGLNFVKIVLNQQDTYNIEFGKVYGATYRIVKTIDDIDVSNLKETFTENTGLYLNL